MDIYLNDVDRNDLSSYELLEKKSDLSYFMSRTRPYDYDKKSQSTLLWKYIVHNDVRIGALWLEKENEESAVAMLGIFIADNEKLCKGIGTRAIEIAVEQARDKMRASCVELHVRDGNARAIRCYEKCGFRETGRFVKEYLNENVTVIVMGRTA